MTAPARYPRRICAYCHQVKVKKAEHKYCSDACARAARRKPRPLCPVCYERPIKFPNREKTCGRVCGHVLRTRGARGVIQLAKMAEARRQADLKRLVQKLAAFLPQLAAATTDIERVKVLGRVYRQGRHDGTSAAYYTYVKGPQRKRTRISA
jgi:hypothetical protein